MVTNVKFDEKGLIPAVVQDATSKEVLTVAYMNEESLAKTIETKETWFYSRSRQELWHKGATSGNIQKVVDIRFDCDQDALVVLVQPAGPACHTGSYSCFSNSLLGKETVTAEDRFAILSILEETIAKREAEMPEGSYTTYLFENGIDKMLKKVGEEAGEVIIAAKNRDADELKWEIADLFFHVLVVMREQKLPLDDVLNTLMQRHGK
ncbi:bifunctional phosphoribosyl-AMP cyclohydrolase/phosphoribosyl-ATP pyrophosphatase [Anaerobacillus alkalidiazotrophicus]|uniref:Histidine biosynthesis bifunctional protein HisIE n=1 Tax=Anaerobacillus alkalidiazotrophicus TaxID=472963 RepID=A0A1S2M8V2_9BACI|nr:bifunctional phosphoribosyl-AMP cyclohydrolase/phosphoribosyl-ATP diphosphatase HisIE [Anaerobacillus alkalidiazotrophicus]OIJ21026.1 bifunctional phosphoribosyl-AMP cyclohydrolase/phosphoribosyl-ATP pyrophosphatase [Anaerobacillus alkalidiazotrophicus]